MFWFVVAVLVAFLLWDRMDLYRRKKGLPGPAFSIPFIGQTLQMILSPFPFYTAQEDYGPLSWNSAGGKYVAYFLYLFTHVY